MKNKPPYAIGSVDHALLLARLLQQEGALSVTEASERLGVARSTAHRLLTMLVYRDFAVQAEDRRYHAGPVLRPAEKTPSPAQHLRDIALPHLHVLVASVNETANLQVRVGRQVRIIATVECSQALRVGDRAGTILSAHLASGGKALLAALDDDQLADLYRGGDVDMAQLRKDLALVRSRAYALNEQQTETGVSATGVLIKGARGDPVAAISLSIPSARFGHAQLPGWVSALQSTAADIAADLVAAHLE
jgi:IclR family transcriptional regulator, acetate operon repressor